MKKPPVIDFETEGIEGRPDYPPRPVGVAIKYPGKPARYYAWGHPTRNNCTKLAADTALRSAYKLRPAMHHAKFDLDVAQEHSGISWPAPEDFEDTMILAYLDDPHNKQIDLKSLSVRYLNRKPAERDELKEWILKNVKESKPSTWGAYICKAPGDLVGRYACADAEMTEGLFTVLYNKILKAGMLGAYAREKALLQVLNGMEKRGINVDIGELASGLMTYEKLLYKIDAWIQIYLGGPFNVESDAELANALDKAGKAENWMLTPTGKRSTSKESIRAAVTDEYLVLMLDYRSTLANYLQNFMRPWYEQAKKTKGLIYTTWHSTKQQEKGGSRTGRLSCTPNLMNVPNDERWKEANDRFAKLFKKYKWLFPLPHVRNYIVAPKNHILLDRDYSQQEPRALAHFEDGVLCEAYKKDPHMDVYVHGVKMVFELTGILLHDDPKFARKIMKTIILAIMYGLGLGNLAERLGITVAEARKFKNAILRAMPGIKILTDDLKARGRLGEPMRTWGGRVYYVEPSRVVDGILKEYGYKLVNYLIQGSCADMTKEAMILYEKAKKHGELLLCVHDELVVVCPQKHWKTEMEILKRVMDSVKLDAPLVTDGMRGTHWGELEDTE